MGVALGGLVGLAVAMGIGRFVYTPILPFMVEDIGLTPSQAGVIASANYLGYLAGALATSVAALPGSRRHWLFWALAMSALSTGAMSFASSVMAFLALRFIGGVASAVVLVFASALVLDHLAAAGRSRLAAVHFAGVGCGIALSALLVAALGAGGYGWRVHWLASGAVSLLAIVAVALLVPAGGKATEPPSPPQGQKPGGRLVRIAAAYGLFGFGYVITATFISAMVRESPDISAAEPVVWLVVGLSAVPSVALWSWIGRRIGNHRSFAIACLVEGIGVAMSVLVGNAAAVVVSAALLGGTFVAISALGLVHACELSGTDPRRILAIMTAVFGVGQTIGPIFAGFAYRIGDSFLAPSLTAAAALFIAAGLAMLSRPADRA